MNQCFNRSTPPCSPKDQLPDGSAASAKKEPRYEAKGEPQ